MSNTNRGFKAPIGIQQVAKMTWKVVSSLTIKQFADACFYVHAVGGRFVINNGTYHNVETVVAKRDCFEKHVQSAAEGSEFEYVIHRALADAGWSYGDFLKGIGAFGMPEGFDAVAIPSIILASAENRDSFIGGFARCIESGYDAEEERFSGGEHAQAQGRKRSLYIAAFSDYLTTVASSYDPALNNRVKKAKGASLGM